MTRRANREIGAHVVGGQRGGSLDVLVALARSDGAAHTVGVGCGCRGLKLGGLAHGQIGANIVGSQGGSCQQILSGSRARSNG